MKEANWNFLPFRRLEKQLLFSVTANGCCKFHVIQWSSVVFYTMFITSFTFAVTVNDKNALLHRSLESKLNPLAKNASTKVRGRQWYTTSGRTVPRNALRSSTNIRIGE